MDERRANIDLAFRNGLKDYEVLPPPDVWNCIDSRIIRKKRPVYFMRAAAFPCHCHDDECSCIPLDQAKLPQCLMIRYWLLMRNHHFTSVTDNFTDPCYANKATYQDQPGTHRRYDC